MEVTKNYLSQVYLSTQLFRLDRQLTSSEKNKSTFYLRFASNKNRFRQQIFWSLSFFEFSHKSKRFGFTNELHHAIITVETGH